MIYTDPLVSILEGVVTNSSGGSRSCRFCGRRSPDPNNVQSSSFDRTLQFITVRIKLTFAIFDTILFILNKTVLAFFRSCTPRYTPEMHRIWLAFEKRCNRR